MKHVFYEKPCANKFVIPEQSAHSKKMKMSILVEEGRRRVRIRIMESWARKLRRSGYPASGRHQVISEAVTKYDKMSETKDKGRRRIHRARIAKRFQKDEEVGKIDCLAQDRSKHVPGHTPAAS